VTIKKMIKQILVAQIVEKTGLKKRFVDDISTFNYLNGQFPRRDGYKYDSFSCWDRAVKRAQVIMNALPSFQQGISQVLDVGCGDGFLVKVFDDYGHIAEGIDLRDWRNDKAKKTRFRSLDVDRDKFPYKDNTFNLVTSFNAFEHFKNPKSVFDEIIRILKPGGYGYFDFAPLYYSAWGLHAYRTIKFPFCHYLFSEDFLLAQLKKLGVMDLNTKGDTLQYVNKWKLAQFVDLFNSSSVNNCFIKKKQSFDYFKIILRYSRCFQGVGIAVEDLITHALTICIEKKM
jgi:SAM-dependent methyltransferase